MTARTFAAWVKPIAEQLDVSRTDLPRVAGHISAEAWDQESQSEGWTYRQILAHIVDTAELRIVALRAALGLEQVAASTFSDIAARDERIERLRGRSIAELLATFDKAAHITPELLTALDATHERRSQDDLALAFGDGLRYFGGHERAHIDELRAAMEVRA